MQNATKNDSITNQTKKASEDFDNYIDHLTLNIQKKLSLSASQNGTNQYHSQAHEYTIKFYNAFKTNLKHDKNKSKYSTCCSTKNEFLTANTKEPGNGKTARIAALSSTSTTNHSCCYNTAAAVPNQDAAIWAEREGTPPPISTTPITEQETDRVEANVKQLIETSNTSNTIIPKAKDTPSIVVQNAEYNANAQSAVVISKTFVGSMMTLVSAYVLFSTMGILAKKYVSTHKKKQRSKQISHYLKEDQNPIIELISSLITFYFIEKLNHDKNLNESKIMRLVTKEWDLLMHYLAKQEKQKKNKEGPHCISDILFRDYSPTDEYAIKEKESLVRDWLGALEETLKKDRASKQWDVFLKKLNELPQQTKADKVVCHNLKTLKQEPAALQSPNTIKFFAPLKNAKNHIENKKQKYVTKNSSA